MTTNAIEHVGYALDSCFGDWSDRFSYEIHDDGDNHEGQIYYDVSLNYDGGDYVKKDYDIRIRYDTKTGAVDFCRYEDVYEELTREEIFIWLWFEEVWDV